MKVKLKLRYAINQNYFFSNLWDSLSRDCDLPFHKLIIAYYVHYECNILT